MFYFEKQPDSPFSLFDLWTRFKSGWMPKKIWPFLAEQTVASGVSCSTSGGNIMNDQNVLMEWAARKLWAAEVCELTH